MLQYLDVTQPAVLRAPAARPHTLAPASAGHVAAITRIYRGQIEAGIGSYEDPLPDEAEMARRLAELTAQGFPAFVALDEDEEVLGFTWATPFRFRAHYRGTVEDSIHIASHARGQGLGESLLRRLIQDCTARGCRQMIAVVGDSRNLASIRLHEKLGFVANGYFPGIGQRPGEVCDVVMLQRELRAEQAQGRA